MYHYDQNTWSSRFKGIPTVFPRPKPGHVSYATTKETRRVKWKSQNAVTTSELDAVFIEIAWALTATTYTSIDNVAFGIIVHDSGQNLHGNDNLAVPVPVQISLHRNSTIQTVIREAASLLQDLESDATRQWAISHLRDINEAARIASEFQTVLNIRLQSRNTGDPSSVPDLIGEFYKGSNAGFGICLDCSVLNHEILMTAVYDPIIINARQISRILRQFENILHWITEAPLHAKLSQVPILNPDDREEMRQWPTIRPEEALIHTALLYGGQHTGDAQSTVTGGYDSITMWITNSRTVNELVPIGAVGELVIEGPEVQADMKAGTACVVPTPPWAEPQLAMKTRFCRTGALVQYNPDGKLCYVGRKENLIKLRGHQVQLEEIECAISKSDLVSDAYVTNKIVGGRTELIAVVCLTDPKLPQYSTLLKIGSDHKELVEQHHLALRHYLLSRLPSHMVPTIWIAVEQLPFKTVPSLWLVPEEMPREITTIQDREGVAVWLKSQDVSAYRLPVIADTGSVAQSPATKTNLESMAHGSSDYASSSSLEALRVFIAQLSKNHPYLKDENIDGVAIATDTQAATLALGQLGGGRGYYIDWNLEFEPNLNAKRLRLACEQVIQHHPILRTVFIQYGPKLFQVALKNVTGGVLFTHPTTTHPIDSDIPRFHLSAGGDQCHHLRFEINHALYDAFSLALIFRDLDAAYTNRPLSDGPTFNDWVNQIEKFDNSKSYAFWKKTLSFSSMSHLIPQAPENPVRGHLLEETVKIHVPLMNLQCTYGTPSSTLKAAWAIVISRALATNDVIFGEITTNRYLSLPKLKEVRGPCVNMVPSRTRLDCKEMLSILIERVHNQFMESLPHHHIGFRSIVKECTSWPQWTKFSSVVVYQNHGALNSFSIGNAKCNLSLEGTLGDAADIFLVAVPVEESLSIEFHFSEHTTPRKQVQWLSKMLQEVLEAFPSSLNRSLLDFETSLKHTLGPYPMMGTESSDNASTGGSIQSNELVAKEAQEFVLRAWQTLELASHGTNEDQKASIWTAGADVATAYLLSKYFDYSGYNVSTENIIRHPMQYQQVKMINAMIMEKKKSAKLSEDS